MFGGAISARLLRMSPRTQTKRETAINQQLIRVSVVPCGRIESLTILSDPRQRSRGAGEGGGFPGAGPDQRRFGSGSGLKEVMRGKRQP